MAATTESLRWATRWPRPVSAPAYDEAREAYLDRLFATGDVVSAYQMGGVGAPGLSDLDLIIVCKDQVGTDLDAAANIAALGEQARYIFMHSQFLVNEEVFRMQRSLFLGSALRHLRGREIAVDQSAPEVDEVLRLSFHVEMMLHRLAGFARVLAGHEAPAVRQLLATLHSIRFNVDGAAAWVEVSDCRRYAEEVAGLRARWFEMAREEALERLFALLRRATDVLTRLLVALRPVAARYHGGAELKGSVAVLEIHEVHRYGDHAPSVFLRRNPVAAALPRVLRRWRPLRPHLSALTEVRVPHEFFVFPATLRSALLEVGERGPARRVRGAAPPEVLGVAVEAMRARAKAFRAIRAFALRNRLRRMSFLVAAPWLLFYPWPYRMKARLLEAAGVGR